MNSNLAPRGLTARLVLAGLVSCLAIAARAQLAPSASEVPALPPEPEIIAMEKFEIVGTRPEAIDATTFKLPTRVLETPRAISVIDSSRIREQDFQSAADLLFWVPGINSNGDSYHFYARGFRMLPNDWKVDGFSGRVTGGSYAPNLFGVENVAVLKGPAGLLYGATSSPGGQISLTSKKPRETRSLTVDARVRTFLGGESSFGEHSSFELETDATGPVTADGRLLYRFLSSNERARLKPSTPDDNQFYRLSFTYKLDRAGHLQLTPLVEWSRENRATRGATLSPSSSRTTNDGRTDYTLADATPRDVNLAAGSRTDDNLTYGADLTARITDRWTASATVRQHARDYANDAWVVQTGTLAQADANDPHSWTVKRRHTRARSEFDTTSLDVNTTYEFFPLSRVKSTVLAGFNTRWQDNQAFTATNGVDQSPVNLHTGIASTPLVADASADVARGTLTQAFVWNCYVQSQTSFYDRLVLSLSGGYTGDTTETLAASGLRTSAKRQSDVTPNAGLVYFITPKISAYTSYSTSFALANIAFEDAQGRVGLFDPTEGDNYEVGLKAEFWGDLLAASVSAFRTELNGVLVQSDADDLNVNRNRYYRQLDSGRASEGVEVEFTVSPVRGWDTTFTYAYIDAYNRKIDGSRATRAEMTPKHATSIYSRYAFRQGKLAGLTTRLGLIWQSDRIGGSSAPTAAAPDPLTLDSFYRVDAGVAYAWRTWNVALNFENLTNENYLIGGSTGLNFDRANPRSAALRVSRFW